MLQVLYLLLEHLKEEHLRHARVQAAPMDIIMKMQFGQSAARRQKMAVESIGEPSATTAESGERLLAFCWSQRSFILDLFAAAGGARSQMIAQPKTTIQTC